MFCFTKLQLWLAFYPLSMNKRSQGKEGEEIALQAYLEEWYSLVERNFTIRGGEIDLIVENAEHLHFVEVKVVDSIDDLHNYITSAKLKHITKTIQRYLHTHPTTKTIQIDIVFVQQGSILEIYRNVTLYN